ncbi:MAG TPA: plasmid stabilization protein [Treponemataceae bacterium]|nr:plasmid stabilization protein [Treponemataceae bacterium]
MYKILFTFMYEEKVKRFLKKHPDLLKQYTKTLQLIELNPFHPSLRLHQFKTQGFEGYSVSINLTYRISLEFLITEKEIILVDIGNHQDIYGKK